MALNFSKFFETYTNHYSFVDLLNLCKEVADYVINHDVIKSEFFDEFKETKKGYEILFNRSGKKNYFIDANKETVKDDKGDDQFIDSVYEEVETLYDIIKNYEIMVNILQIDEKVKTFNQIFENEHTDWNCKDFPYEYDEVGGPIKSGDYVKTIYVKGVTPVSEEDFEENGGGEIFIVGEIENDKLYVKGMGSWWYKDECVKLDVKTNEKVKTFNQIFPSEQVNEGFDDELKGKLSDKYTSLKRGILELLDKTLGSDTTKLQTFINSYVDPNSDEILEGFVEDAQIFDVYLKYQSDVDQILLDNNYYDDPPEVESLYDYVIDGTFDAMVYCMEEIKKDLYES